jgi:hypothetical protein
MVDSNGDKTDTTSAIPEITIDQVIFTKSPPFEAIIPQQAGGNYTYG